MDPKDKLLVRPVSAGLSEHPKMPNRGASKLLWDVILDLIFLLLSGAFFVFAVLVRSYDQAPVAQHLEMADALRKATLYVRSQYAQWYGCTELTNQRDQRYSQYCLQL